MLRYAFSGRFFSWFNEPNMYIKAPKRMGDTYAAAVTESGEKTRCVIKDAVVCDVDDVWVRFVVETVDLGVRHTMGALMSSCFAACPLWCSENDLPAPSDMVSPINVFHDKVTYVKARVPRDGYVFRSGDCHDITLCVRDVKLSGGRLFINWRVEGYGSPKDNIEESHDTDSLLSDPIQAIDAYDVDVNNCDSDKCDDSAYEETGGIVSHDNDIETDPEPMGNGGTENEGDVSEQEEEDNLLVVDETVLEPEVQESSDENTGDSIVSVENTLSALRKQMDDISNTLKTLKIGVSS